MTKVKRMDEHGLLQMNIWMIWPPPFLCKWSFAKRTVLRMTKIKGTEEQELFQMIIRRIRPPLFLCKCSLAKRCPSDDQNKRDGGARIAANDQLYDTASSVLLCYFANGHLQRGQSSGSPTFFWSDFAPELSLVWRILNKRFQLKRTNSSGVRAKWPMNIDFEVRWLLLLITHCLED